MGQIALATLHFGNLTRLTFEHILSCCCLDCCDHVTNQASETDMYLERLHKRTGSRSFDRPFLLHQHPLQNGDAQHNQE